MRRARTRAALAATGLAMAGLALSLTAPAGAAPAAPMAWGKILSGDVPLAGWRIAVDAGHNGGNSSPEASKPVADGRGGEKPCNTFGTSTADGYPEHEFTFEVAQLLQDRLAALGATVLPVRDSDDGVGPCVDVRGTFAEDNNADLLLSLHADGSEDTSLAGFYAIVADPPLSPSQEEPSRTLAFAVVTALTDAGFTKNPLVDDGVQLRADLATLNFSRRPAVLVELGEMRNPGEAAVMASDAGRDRYAEALTAAVLDWAREQQSTPPGSTP